jgi:gluconate 2-dehydrogenase gamma chain
MTFISRRDLLKRVGAAAAAPVVRGSAGRPRDTLAGQGPPAWFSGDEPAVSPAGFSGGEGATSGLQAVHGQPRLPLENLTAQEAELMDAIVARLIPTDETGPGAAEARAVHYIDRALGGALAASRQTYTAGLAALDRYAQSSRGAPFTRLSATDQDSVLIDVETGTATGFTGGSAAFFAMVLNHTHQGTFGDPYYGGNANFVGWDLLGYPGVRTIVTAADQHGLESGQLKSNHKSAYEYESFTKASYDHEA